MVEGNPEYAPTSQEIKAMAGQGEWSSNDYSSDPDYSNDKIGAAMEAFEHFGIDNNRLMTDGGEDMPEGYAEAVTDAVEEYDGDARAADAEFHNSEGTTVPDTNTRERDWSDHPSEYDENAMGMAIHALEIMGARQQDGDIDPRLTEAGDSEFGVETPMSDNIGYHTIERR